MVVEFKLVSLPSQGRVSRYNLFRQNERGRWVNAQNLYKASLTFSCISLFGCADRASACCARQGHAATPIRRRIRQPVRGVANCNAGQAQRGDARRCVRVPFKKLGCVCESHLKTWLSVRGVELIGHDVDVWLWFQCGLEEI